MKKIRENDYTLTHEPHEDYEDDNSDSTEANHVQQQPDDIESSSTASEGGKGTGSGGGYSADCSSSDASSDDVAKGAVPETEMKCLRVSVEVERERELEQSKGEGMAKTKKRFPRKKNSSSVDSSHRSAENTWDSKDADEGDEVELEKTALPQWNGVRIHHPMDPRIDLSTVGHIQTSSLSVFPSNVMQFPLADGKEGRPIPEFPTNHATPSIDQYMSLLEVVRPFFHAHGFSHFHSVEGKSDYQSIDITSCASNQNQNSNATYSGHHQETSVKNSDAVNLLPRTNLENNHSRESDSSSMVVLARVKRKHLRNRSTDDPVDEGSNNSSYGGSNASSTSSSEKRVRIRHPALRTLQDESKNGEETRAVDDQINDNDNPVDPGVPHDDGRDERQESTSASSSESQNNLEGPQNPAGGFGVPAVVSEYSSSRTGSSGASNNNQMSTSGSGSGGNTGSGTGSGSNQGGSSGSGNDQGGISSNGNGSSASGNDIKGSSEETMDNSGENNSGEGNSDATNSKHRRHNHTVANGAAEPSYSVGHRHYANVNEMVQRDAESPTHSSISSSQINSMAVRERKLQDKKRKRMNMRREYEEKVQQEMESSEGSIERDENMLLKPGRPVTLDKVLSFTKVPRIVVSASPPFLVVHTNAAYCRLSGIDSHLVVGKPISNLLRVPDPQTLANVQADGEQLEEELAREENHEFDSATGGSVGNHELTLRENDESIHSESRRTQGLSAAEAAGRARAAASQEDSVERLIATSGFGRYNVISLNAKPLIGQNFTIVKPSEIAQSRRSREEGSNGSSITSNCEGSYRHIPCSMGVSPVVSSPEAFATLADKDQDSHHHKPKRRKHQPNEGPSTSLTHHLQPRRNFLHREVSLHRKRHLITHYVIQLEPLDGGPRKEGSQESQSSTSTTLEAQVLGMTKSELQRQRGHIPGLATTANQENDSRYQELDDAVMDSESSNPHEAVTAVG